MAQDNVLFSCQSLCLLVFADIGLADMFLEGGVLGRVLVVEVAWNNVKYTINIYKNEDD